MGVLVLVLLIAAAVCFGIAAVVPALSRTA
jgi:hypothetical protein